jgi:FKBP-type peptidyl-prolyl cis-trans isomerase FkpA
MSEVTAVPIRPVKPGALTRLWLGVGAACVVSLGLAWAGTQAVVATSGSTDQFLAWHKSQSGVIATKSGLQYKVIKKGEGPSPTDEDVALVNYKGTLRDGVVFDERQRQPMPVAQMTEGFKEALKLMSRGGSYRLWIPPALGYGDAPPPGSPIKADSVLIFDVDMIDFKNMAALQAEMQQLQQQQMQDGGQPGGAPQR